MITPKKSTTLVIADTLNHEQAIKTIQHNRSKMRFDHVLWFSDLKANDYRLLTTAQNIDVIIISTIKNRDDYSHLINKTISKYIQTEQALITQTDGFIYNEDGWKEEFEDYDYIGAPWWYYPFNHVSPHPPSGPRTCVGNGGFSLRSSRLLKRVTELANTGKYTTLPEDLFTCRTCRPILEKEGMTWAPEHLAHQFCCEDRPYEQQFGVHGHETFKLNKELIKP